MVGHGGKCACSIDILCGTAEHHCLHNVTHLEVQIPSRIHELRHGKQKWLDEISDEGGRQAGTPVTCARTELLPMSSRMAPTPCTALLAMASQLLGQWPSGCGDMPWRVRAGRQAAAGTARRRDVRAGSRAAAAFLASWRQRSGCAQQLWAHTESHSALLQGERLR